jgi:hypothetical protein
VRTIRPSASTGPDRASVGIHDDRFGQASDTLQKIDALSGFGGGVSSRVHPQLLATRSVPG